MNKSIYAVVLVLVLLAMVTIVTVPPAAGAATGDQAAHALGSATGNGEAVQRPAGPETMEPLCPSPSVDGFGGIATLPWAAQPQVGPPCCESLCDQVCGVGEPCLCKRCQVLGCGV